MTTFYVDPVLGNDANAGSAWGAGTAWKTIGYGATAVRIAPGDIIRVAKSPDPTSVGNATWANRSASITLAAAKTAVIDMCDSNWTVGPYTPYVTCASDSTYRKEGSYSQKITIPGSYWGIHLAAYIATGTLNLSTYQQISFWIYCSGNAIPANNIRLTLCSDTTASVIVNSFTVPAITAGGWHCVTLDYGSALGASIQSIGIETLTSDLGQRIIYLDNIIACKASSSADSLTLSSLISKNSLATGGDEGWFPIKSINGTTVILDDNTPSSVSGTGQGYYGTSETVTTYKREGFILEYSNAEAGVNESGSAGSLTEYQGGYNPSNGNQDGETYFVSRSAYSAFTTNGCSYIKSNKINSLRPGIVIDGSWNDITFHSSTKLSIANDCSGNIITAKYIRMITIGSLADGNVITAVSVCSSPGVGIAVGGRRNLITVTNCCNHLSYNLSLIQYGHLNRFIVANCKYSSDYGIAFGVNCFENFFHDLVSSNNTNGAILPYSAGSGSNYFINSTVSESPKVSALPDYYNQKIVFQKYAGALTDNRTYTDNGNIMSQTTTRHTASGVAWKLSPTSSFRYSGNPLVMPIRRVALAANSQVTVNCWFQRSNTGITGKLVCRGKQILGVDSDVIATASAGAGNWEQLTIQFTPTEAGVVEIQAWAYGGTTYSVYVDDVEVLQ